MNDILQGQAGNLTPSFGDYGSTHHNGFIMLTRGWQQEFLPLLGLNQLHFYMTVGSYYNLRERRSYPGNDEFEAYFLHDDSALRRVRRSISLLGLVEWWRAPFRYKGKTHVGEFFRMPYVDERGKHIGVPKQPTAYELLAWKASGHLPEGYEWVLSSKTKLLTPLLTEEQIQEARHDKIFSDKRKCQRIPQPSAESANV